MPWPAKCRPSAVYRSRVEASSRMKNRSAVSAPPTSARNTTAALPDAGIGIRNTGCNSNSAERSSGRRNACSGCCTARM